ncbi:MAG: phosphoribosyltransferase [Chthoniobacterales bacterium]
MQFKNRACAGAALAERLQHYRGQPAVIVLALPRGGVPVAAEVARSLEAPLDVLVVRKLGVPGWEELAMGAIASGGTCVMNDEVIGALGLDVRQSVDQVLAAEREELRSREDRYRGGKPFPDLRGRCVILVDDGLATGATMRAAARAVRQQGAARIVIAVPVGAPSTCHDLGSEADEVICAATPESFFGVGQFYADFRQTTDDEVRQLLSEAKGCPTVTPGPGPSSH